MNIRQSIRNWSTYRKTVRALEQLDNRMLDDLGISRGDIRQAVRDRASSL